MRVLRVLLASPAARIVLIAVAWRCYSALLAFYTNVVFPLARPEPFTVLPSRHLFWDSFARYDAGWYYSIARYGYEFVEGGRNNLAFFPVYPTLMGWLGWLLGDLQASYYLAGVAISWSAFAAAMVVLYRLARMDLGEDGAFRAVVYCMLFPFGLFFGKVYPESTFLLFSLLSVFWVRQGRWVRGGLAAALMTATRPNGAAGVPGLTWLVFQTLSGTRRRALATVAFAGLALAGVGSYSLFVYWLSGSALEWAAAISRWNYYVGSHAPWSSLVRLAGNLIAAPYAYLTTVPTAPYDTINGLAAGFFAALVPFVWRRLGRGYALYMAGHLIVPLSSGEYEGLGRYCAVLFPAFIYLASFESPAVRMSIPVVFATLYAVASALFTNLYPLF